ncbi:SMAD/FHA domain-containing protein [Violaceomyces palustris]|uniref:SMAD/FHA domain-containing protein n=1 Tax=Violaceomyces palustris TaxID=1673888 RepID=A0ACD0NNP4_9BASI|nr:SMAD/FHA domain-containing protein [Violaceomyces palustris]
MSERYRSRPDEDKRTRSRSRSPNPSSSSSHRRDRQSTSDDHRHPYGRGDRERSRFDSGSDSRRRPGGGGGDDHQVGSSRHRQRDRRDPPPPSSSSKDFEDDRRRERRRYLDRTSEHPPPPSSHPIERNEEEEEEEEEDDKPNFERSGLLAAESNNLNGVALKYQEPSEARKPKRNWRLYVFKDGKEIDMLTLGRQSCYLLGRDRTVTDIPIDHPSCSKQHAVIQFRQIVNRNEFGDEKRLVKPFLIDLESANGSLVNDQEIPPSRYYELVNGDTLKFGASSREYVLLDEGSV